MVHTRNRSIDTKPHILTSKDSSDSCENLYMNRNFVSLIKIIICNRNVNVYTVLKLLKNELHWKKKRRRKLERSEIITRISISEQQFHHFRPLNASLYPSSVYGTGKIEGRNKKSTGNCFTRTCFEVLSWIKDPIRRNWSKKKRASKLVLNGFKFLLQQTFPREKFLHPYFL